MANKRVTDLDPIATAPVSGVMHFIDTTDSTQNAAGSSFKVTKEDFLKENTEAILLNTAKVGFTDALVNANANVTANTAKVGITTGQASAIVDNTAKILLKANTLDVVAQNGGTIYTNAKTFVPTGTFSSVGTTVTITGSQLSSSMVASKIGLENDKRIIVSFINANQVLVESAFSENYTGIISSNWGVFCNVLFTDASSNIFIKTGRNDTGSKISILRGDNTPIVNFDDARQTSFNGSVLVTTIISSNNVALKNGKIVVGNGSNVGFSGGDWNGSVDTAISRLSAGLLELNTGIAGNRTQLALSKILVNVAVDNGVDSAIINGTISASPATSSNQVVVKSQLDLKANDSDVVKLTGAQNIEGDKTFANDLFINNGSDTIRISKLSGANGRLVISRPNNILTESVSFGGGNDQINIQGGLGQIRHGGANFEITNTTTSGALVLTAFGSVVLRGASNAIGVTMFSNTRNTVFKNGGTFVDNGVDIIQGIGSISCTTLKTSGFTVATLPTPPAQGEGARAHVTDASNPTYLGALTGGGTVKCPVFYNGTAWVSA